VWTARLVEEMNTMGIELTSVLDSERERLAALGGYL
jgi:hypothetical protein